MSLFDNLDFSDWLTNEPMFEECFNLDIPNLPEMDYPIAPSVGQPTQYYDSMPSLASLPKLPAKGTKKRPNVPKIQNKPISRKCPKAKKPQIKAPSSESETLTQSTVQNLWNSFSLLPTGTTVKSRMLSLGSFNRLDFKINTEPAPFKVVDSFFADDDLSTAVDALSNEMKNGIEMNPDYPVFCYDGLSILEKKEILSVLYDRVSEIESAKKKVYDDIMELAVRMEVEQ